MKSRRLVSFVLCLVLLLSALPARAAEEAPVRIAFLDSGVSTTHLDADRVEAGENFVFPGRDTVDRIGHGTATAGIVLGSNELGLAGVCPSAVVVPLVCSDVYPTGVEAPGDAAAMAQAICAAVDRYDCRIINISMGTTDDDERLRAAVEYALERGALIVTAVGNENINAPERIYYPAAYEGVIGVGAADGDAAADFSQRSGVDVLAPGVALETVSNRNAAKVVLRSGTSYACAVVSGICAALWSANPAWTADEVRQALFTMARDVAAPGFDAESGWGVVQAGVHFVDMSGHWAREAAELCAAEGILNGVGGGRFDPNALTTRAMLAVCLYRMAGEPQPGGAVSFPDVAEGAWYTRAVAWGTETGLFTGYDSGLFGTDDRVTREQTAAVLYRCALARGMDTQARADLAPYADADSVSAYAAEAMQWACASGVITGRGQGGALLLDPHGDATRAELAVMLARFLRLAAQ